MFEGCLPEYRDTSTFVEGNCFAPLTNPEVFQCKTINGWTTEVCHPAAYKIVLSQKTAIYRNPFTSPRWTFLTNGASLVDKTATHLNPILNAHPNFAVCYAMRERLTQPFTLQDTIGVSVRSWLQASKESRIPPLVHFAEIKELRLPGPINHAILPVSNESIEELNTKSPNGSIMAIATLASFPLFVRLLSCQLFR